ncbi:hypothetical protein, conserved [Plasmodium malariae]|uniref:Uncharacterized protein n=1 Tax=Plasmodium malariae TaxID=5858 RepID=A0A1A8X1E0_PLAMA|nr:hypothetical protein, conserved [Plasmodium malariae]
MDPYKFNSWIRILIALCSTGAYILISLMLPLFVHGSFFKAVPSFDAVYGIFFVAPYNDNKYITWYKFEDHICKNGKRYEDLSKTKHYEKNIRSKLCNSINFLKHYLLIAFIVALINLIVVKGTLIYAHFREHPETSSIKHVSFCNKIMALIVCLTLTNCALFGNSHYLHAGFYILLSDFVSHFLIIIFIKRDKTILKCVCELELLPWEQKPKLPVHNTQFNDTLIIHVLFQDDNLNEEKLKNFFGTSNYEEIYYIIMNNIKAKKEMMNTYP